VFCSNKPSNSGRNLLNVKKLVEEAKDTAKKACKRKSKASLGSVDGAPSVTTKTTKAVLAQPSTTLHNKHLVFHPKDEKVKRLRTARLRGTDSWFKKLRENHQEILDRKVNDCLAVCHDLARTVNFSTLSIGVGERGAAVNGGWAGAHHCRFACQCRIKTARREVARKLNAAACAAVTSASSARRTPT